MKHIFQADTKGAYKSASGQMYSVECVDSASKTPKGWSNSLEKALSKAPQAPIAQQAQAQDNEPSA